MEKISIEAIIKKYYRLFPYYSRLGENVEDALNFFFEERGLKIASIDFRVKKLDSFLMKIKRKKYDKPFDMMEDFCGIRIVCFFQSDITKIENIIKKEFEVVDKDKKELLPTQFGYRSNHLIIKIKDSWTKAPNYRGLQNLKIEVQVRTILMHAWAEIEHKLAYKKETHIPDEFRRKFSLLSAKLEEVDEQFEKLASDIKKKNEKLRLKNKQEKSFDENLVLNLDTLQLFLDYFFPNKHKSIKNTRDLLDDVIFTGLTLKDLFERSQLNIEDIKNSQIEVDGKDKIQTDEFRRIIKLQ